jgi:hypothetical protein
VLAAAAAAQITIAWLPLPRAMDYLILRVADALGAAER